MTYSSNIGRSVGIAVIDAWGIPARNEIHLRSYPGILNTFCFHMAQPVATISLFRIGVYGYLLKALLRLSGDIYNLQIFTLSKIRLDRSIKSCSARIIQF